MKYQRGGDSPITQVDFCHGMPIPASSERANGIYDYYNVSYEEFHNMWADASDATETQDARGTGLKKVNPHELVKGKITSTINKYYSISAHQDTLDLQIWDDNIPTHGQLAKIAEENTCWRVQNGQTNNTDIIDLTNLGTHDDQGTHLGAVVIHSAAVHTKIDGNHASYLEMALTEAYPTLEFQKIPHNPTQSPDVLEKEIREIFRESNADIMLLLQKDNCTNFWKLCEYWATRDFQHNFFDKGQIEQYFEEQKDAMVLDGIQARNIMEHFNANVQHKTSPPDNNTVIFFGDLHCSVGSLAKILLKLKERQIIDANTGGVNQGYSLISGGDLIDRGYLGVSCVLLVYFVLLQTTEGYVGVCRGNHEMCRIAMVYGFENEIDIRRYPDCDDTKTKEGQICRSTDNNCWRKGRLDHERNLDDWLCGPTVGHGAGVVASAAAQEVGNAADAAVKGIGNALSQLLGEP